MRRQGKNKMISHKRIREQGKLSLANYFEELKKGDRVALITNLGYKRNFPDRLHGRTGIIFEKRGRAYVIKVNDGKKEKTFIVSKVHIKKLKDKDD